MSKKNMGEYATPDEALELMVEAHPQKDIILKADVGTGSGNTGGAGSGGASRVIRRSEFDKMAPQQQSQLLAKMRTGEIRLTD